MNAIVHGNLPKKVQERPFAEILHQLDFGSIAVHVWYTRVLGTRDIDVILLCEGIGLFVVEVKSINLSAIARIDESNGLHLHPNVVSSTKKPPWQQACEAAESLQSRFQSSDHYKNGLGKLWISSAAALFAISRGAFKSVFGNEDKFEHACQLLSGGMIFAEDLQSGNALLERLNWIRQNPLHKAKPKFSQSTVYNAKTAAEIDNFINWTLAPAETLTPREMERLKHIEKFEERRLDAVSTDYPVICSGFAGTGKTILGLQYALRRRVPALFVCFNKVLATDIRRLTTMGSIFAGFPFDCADVSHLILDCERQLGLSALPYDSRLESAADYEQRRVNRILEMDRKRKERLTNTWNLIVVDEAQDLSRAAWDLLNHLAGSFTQLFVVRSQQQLLYREEEDPYLQEVLLTATPEQNKLLKRRVYRTTSETFLLGQLFVDNFPDLEKAQRAWSRTLRPQYLKASERSEQSNLDFELSRPKGRAPELKGLDVANSDQCVETVAASITATLSRFHEFGGTNSDLLILLPFSSRKDCIWHDIAVSAVTKCGLAYCDYTDSNLRRLAHAPNQVRLTTYHSSRGIESLHSIILGFEHLIEAAQSSNKKAANLGYIALTRSAFTTELFYRKGAEDSRQIAFLHCLISTTGF